MLQNYFLKRRMFYNQYACVRSTHYYVIYTRQHDEWNMSVLSAFTHHLSFVARAGAWNKERRILVMHRCDVSNVCGCHGVATCLARYALITSLERKPNERENERPALSKDKGGNSPRQIIEWPDSASLFLPLFLCRSASILLHLDLLSFLTAPLESTRSTGFSCTLQESENLFASMDDAIRQFRRCIFFSLL